MPLLLIVVAINFICVIYDMFKVFKMHYDRYMFLRAWKKKVIRLKKEIVEKLANYMKDVAKKKNKEKKQKRKITKKINKEMPNKILKMM